MTAVSPRPQGIPTPIRKLFFLGNPEKRECGAVLQSLLGFVKSRCEVVGSELSADGRKAIAAGADAIVILGGDGTLIGVARSLGRDQIPLIGVNLGKLGFLAEFSVEEFRGMFDRILRDASLVNRRLVLKSSVERGSATLYSAVAVNDCVIHAGPPFRVITLAVEINGRPLTEVSGDGLIVGTPTGSTAHSLSAGGPIVQPGVSAIVMTPLCPHSLTHKAIVMESDARITIRIDRANAGTTAIIDGQASWPLRAGDLVQLSRFEHDLLPVRNPLHPPWHKLVTKLHWGKLPNYD